MVGGTSAGGTAAAGAAPPPSPRSGPPPKTRRVAVVGGGYAGLACARALLQSAPSGAVAVTLFEASDDVGGRARSGQLACSPVELGATW